ncbi:hypothetical protein BAUCODRAFT_301984 [Baudoinia panamericana UAMH 10762]|uniref:NEDD8-activating enzyme E1 regulatory subunit n=1 Tax=Baudoinia panamericana (strain UAMH 10762) TaxID=717646 RepID=M2MYI0_BAUPA|nr:uncharacterized protein BAUCODRAFT_301984 [Baudoinia panamericana UAMH 10762]EMC91714.1 hypothetical protein BAUCODRAFT_301984 [Baudoinia panamericana UAMH 10762]
MASTNGQEVPPPLQDIPTAKEKKYDRQLRLWGAAGQVALEESHILLLNSGAGVTGVETLKNLVLPGIGQFSILDSAIVTEADLGVNFFVEDASLGRFRAAETVRMLEELNPGVKGHAITETVDTFFDVGKGEVAPFQPYNLIIVAAPIEPTWLTHILHCAQALHIPVFYLHCVGYFSSFAVTLPPAFPIVDTHPDPTATTDLRLLKPWPALAQFAAEKTAMLNESESSMGEEDDATSKEREAAKARRAHDKAHIPYLCLLLHYLEQWKQSHDGNVPATYKEKTAFRNLVRAGDYNEENFDEACTAVLRALNPPTPPSSILDILSAPETHNLTPETPAFWLIANAINQFYTKHNQLPLPGSVPDMKAESSVYVQLQNIYKSKARDDSAEVLATVRELEKETNRPQHLAVDAKEVENFCKGAAHIHLVRGRAFQTAQSDASLRFGDGAKVLAMELSMPESLVGLHLAFLAWDRYIATHSTSAAPEVGGERLRVPGGATTSGADDDDEAYEADVAKVTSIAHTLLDHLITESGTGFLEDPEYSEARERVGKFVRELVRAGGGELHNVASVTGGLVAQEVIKVVTRQYVPVEGVCLFDGVQGRTQVLRV